MKTTIFYFSGTGNSLVVARHIADKLDNTEIIPIAKVIDEKLDLSADRIGIVFPVYMWGLPLIIADFIKKIKTDKDKYIFSVATYGGMAGSTNRQVANILNINNLQLSAGFLVQMPDNYIPFFNIISIEKQEKLFFKEKEKIMQIVDIVKQKKKYKIEKSNFILNFIFSTILYKISSPKIPKMDKSFWTDEKCDSCGICEKVCPVNNIKLESGKPVWQNKCQQCLTCLHFCPKESIQFKQKTQTRKRYKHPDVVVKDFILENQYL